jgi:hypothetical protein
MTILNQLSHVREVSARLWLARCPVSHPTPQTLVVRRAPDGTMSFSCSAGCSQRDVERALGMRGAAHHIIV